MPDTTLEPRPSDFEGAGATARRLFAATRPKFFTASVLPVLVGFAWGWRAGGPVEPLVVALAILATVAVHAASNVFNDVGDDINGTDAANEQHIYPFTGGSRFIPNAIMSRAQMLRFSLVLFGVGALLGAGLIALKGVTVLWFGLAGIALGVLYSLPAVQLMARGAGELSIAVAFGLIPVTGAAWLVTGTIDAPAIYLSLAVGLWVAAILQINEVPDMAADAAAGKRNLAVRLGARGARAVYLGMQIGAFAIIAAMTATGALPPIAVVLPAVLLALGVRAALTIGPAPNTRIVTGIKLTLAIQLLGCLWLVAVLLLF